MGGGGGGDKGRDDCAIRIATWNICDGCSGGLEAAARGLKKMNVPITVLQDTKGMGGNHTRCTSGYTMLASDTPSKHRGRVALVWVENHPAFEVELARL